MGNRHDGRNDLGGGSTRERNRNRSRSDRRLTTRATSNVELMDAGQSNQLQQQLQQAQQDYLRSTQAAQSIWPGVQGEMADIQRPQFGRIEDEFNTALGTVKDLFGGGEAAPYMSSGEGAAGMGLGNAYGEAGATMTANADSREGMWRERAQHQAGLEGQYAQDNLLQSLQDTLQGYNDSMGQLKADDPWQIQNESTRLWEQQQQAKALASKTKSDQAFSEWLQGNITGMTDSNGPRHPGTDGHGNTGPGPGNGPGPNGGVHPPSGIAGATPAQGGYGDTSAGGNQFGGATWPQRAGQINEAETMGGVPQWLKQLYNQNGPGPQRWEAAQELSPQRTQIYRRTRPHVRDLYTTAHPGSSGLRPQGRGYQGR